MAVIVVGSQLAVLVEYKDKRDISSHFSEFT